MKMDIPKTHPRYQSLITREKIAEGIEIGITGEIGLIAHGRGEAFDYLIGEKTTVSAYMAETAAAAALLLARRPVISVNGNTAALVPGEIIKLANTTDAGIEVNLFYRTKERHRNILRHLQKHGASKLYTSTDARIPDLPHNRAIVDSLGIYKADTVLVPLEDGDRCSALKRMGKTIITIDLNPMSRTAKTADITIVDNLTRAIPNIITIAEELKNKTRTELQQLLKNYNNQQTLKDAIKKIITYLNSQPV
ncbi:MAG: 4-phosphopantoate--beta-alanine ligase [Candidatus Argoarchaeum ethanivorans]|uniref:4-phosphopantoate--beta-alanine ligase n=1 Tax=Candidatus Argoarchaeum ethanivorans TaxID=2608793 RepID=A0A811T6X1_9EURY|nr:MAG: 4-phosphopantoate--beta-alanine ligase [Candidatus Argoarchaeum ethanivorans]